MKTQVRRNCFSPRLWIQLCKHATTRDATPCDSEGTSLGMKGNMGRMAEQQDGGHVNALVIK